MRLTDTECKSFKPKAKPYKVTDGKGLYLEVMPNGSKYWRLKYRYGGKEKRLAFGVYPEVSIAEARGRQAEARKLIYSRVDPSEIKRMEKITHLMNSFEYNERNLNIHQIFVAMRTRIKRMRQEEVSD